MRNFSNNSNVDNSDLSNYPDARIKDNTGSLDGTPVNERVYGDVIQFFLKLKRLAGITANDLPDNETNGFQTIQSLKEFATKNNYIQNISSVSGVLNVSAKIGLMQNDEFLVCKSSIDLGAETQIKGTDGVINTITTIGTFKTNEYVRLIKTASTIFLVRISDAASLDLMVSELLYLKKASQSEENAGTSDLVATTPLTNKTVFSRRVNGVDSPTYLATALINGLYPKEHWSIVNGLIGIRNKGSFEGLSISINTGSLAVNGDFTSAVATVGTYESFILVTMANAMDDLDYYVESNIQSQGSIGLDNDITREVFKPISTTQFQMSIKVVPGSVTNLKFNLKVIQN